MEVSQGQRSTALEVRNPGPGAAAQSDRTRAFALCAMRRAPARATDRNRRERPCAGGHGQRAARSQVERLDPEDLDAGRSTTAAASAPVRPAAATPLRRLRDRARSAHGRASHCSADGESPSCDHRAMLSTVSRSPSSGSSAASHTKLLRVHNSVAMYRLPLLPRVGQQRRHPSGQLAKLSLVHEAPRSRGSARCSFPT